jgi:hypothetical protein
MTSGRTRLTAAVALAVALVIGLVLAVAGGADGGDESRLAWKGKVELIDSTIGTDRILYGKVENTSLREIDLDAKAIKVFDAEGREVYSAARFLAAFAHGLYPWSMRDEMGDGEKRRIGEIATLKPGQAIPITLSWRVEKGGEQPVRADFGPAEIAIPKRGATKP